MARVLVVPIPVFYRLQRCGFGAYTPPVSGRVSSGFGPRVAPTAGASTDHKGIDYAVPVGTPVAASADGVVRFAGVQSGFGNVVQVDHGGGVVTTYAHLSSIGVSAGQPVRAGDFLGASGATGTVTGPNLHFGVAVNGAPVDPLTWLASGAPGPVDVQVPPILQIEGFPNQNGSVLAGVSDDALVGGMAAALAGLALVAVLS